MKVSSFTEYCFGYEWKEAENQELKATQKCGALDRGLVVAFGLSIVWVRFGSKILDISWLQLCPEKQGFMCFFF